LILSLAPFGRDPSHHQAKTCAITERQSMSQPLVSVVTPFHNTAPYLAECIQSVLDQRYSPLEYVLLNNCSSDGSQEIAAEFARKDGRIRLFDNTALLQQVPNYNRALSYCAPSARYVKVVEADNWLFPECIARMVELAESHPNVGVVSSYNTTETRLRLTGLPLKSTVLTVRELFDLTFRKHLYLFGAPTTVLMRADLVRARQPFYDERLSTAEDLSACWDLLRESDFGFVHQVLTFVRTENDSILSNIRGFDGQELDRYLVAGRHAQDILAQGEADAFLDDAERRYYRALAKGLIQGRRSGFLAFHRDRLTREGVVFSQLKLVRAMLRETGAHLLRPEQMREAVRGWRSRLTK
jgi:glycosyltransferase involved in cell wall biosynthesis